jgi:hypothetical protein
MHESFTLEFRKDGELLPVSSFDPDEGLVFGDEQGAWPLTIAVGLAANAPGTEMQMRWVMRAHGWLENRIFKLDCTLQDNRLRFTGVDPKALPAGLYKLRLEVKGVPLERPEIAFEIKKGQDAAVTAQVRPERRGFVFVEDLINPGDVSQRVLLAEGSRIDGKPLVEWLRDPRPRMGRKACLLNIVAKLRMEPNARSCVCEGLRSIFFADVDRIYAAAEPGLLDRVKAIPGVDDEGPPGHPGHKRLRKKIPNAAADRYPLRSFRIGELNSLQIVVATPPGDVEDRTEYADIDIDLGNPLASLVGLVVHIGELFDPGQTDHLKLFDRLSRSDLREFLYYRVEQAATA